MHAHMRNASRYSDYASVVDLTPQRRGLIRSAWLGALYATLALNGGYVWQREFGKLEEVNVEALGAVLLLVPGLAAIYVSRPGEHGLAARFAFGTRFATVMAAGAAVLATMTLALGLTGDVLAGWWGGLCIAAGLPTLYLTYVHQRAGQKVDFDVQYG